MNFLAHLYLAEDDDAFLVGNLMGDFVKGRIDSRLPDQIAAGIRLHRRIDSYSDAHGITRRSRDRMTPGRRRVAGIIVDMAYDHFLARHWARFSEEPLTHFTQRSYAALYRHHDSLPPRLRRILPRMAGEDWLRSYRRLDTIGVALDRIASRLSRPTTLPGAVADIRAAYDGLESDFLAFLPQALAFAQTWRRGDATWPDTVGLAPDQMLR